MSKPAYEVGPAHLSVDKAIEWVAFGGTLPKWPQPLSFSPEEAIRSPSTSLMEALEARAGGKVWKPDYPVWGATWPYRAWARQVMQELRLPADECLQRLQEMQDSCAGWNAKCEWALGELNRVAATGRLVVEGRPSATSTTPATSEVYRAIPAEHWDGLRKVDAWGWFKIAYDETHWKWAHDPGPFFYEVRFRIDDVHKLWSAPSASEAEANGLQCAPEAAEPALYYRTGTPGRPTSKQLVEAEMKRRAAAGLMRTSLKAEAEELATWLQETHPLAPRMGPKTMQNALRALYRELSAA